MEKLHDKPHKCLDGRASGEPLELVHMDMCGPMLVASLSGNKYIFVIVDNYSRFTCVYFVKTKDEAYDQFIEYINKYENKLGKRIKKVRSDNGTEFVNRRFQDFFRGKGIEHQRTVPYNPQSNGIAERENRTLLDKARMMLIDANLPPMFWAEAVSIATYLKNVALTKGNADKTPIESGKVRNLQYHT